MAESISEAFSKALKRLSGKRVTEERSTELKRRDGEETLKRTLNRMYREYRDSVNPKPDYAEKYGTGEVKKPEFPRYEADGTLLKTAQSTADEASREKRAAAEAAAANAIGASEEKKSAAKRSYAETLKEAEERGQRAAANAEGRIWAQGLNGSSIATHMRDTAAGYAEELRTAAAERYEREKSAAEEKIRGAEDKLKSALKNFEIADAVKTEKELKRLTAEREKALKTFREEYLRAEKATEKGKAEIERKIAADETARDEAFRNRDVAEPDRVYEGEEKREMESRLAAAQAFYASIPKEKARGLIANSADELKFLLGNYYGRLIAALKLN